MVRHVIWGQVPIEKRKKTRAEYTQNDNITTCSLWHPAENMLGRQLTPANAVKMSRKSKREQPSLPRQPYPCAFYFFWMSYLHCSIFVIFIATSYPSVPDNWVIVGRRSRHTSQTLFSTKYGVYASFVFLPLQLTTSHEQMQVPSTISTVHTRRQPVGPFFSAKDLPNSKKHATQGRLSSSNFILCAAELDCSILLW